MKESIEIYNFGPLRNVVVEDIRPLTVLIGESGSGKSTFMKVLSLFRWMYKRVNIRSYVQHARIARTGIGFKILPLLRMSGILEYLHSDSVIIYRRGQYEIKMQNGSTNIRFKIAPEHLSIEKVCFISEKRNIISEYLNGNTDHRAIGYHLQDTLDNFKLAVSNIESMSFDYLGVQFKYQKSKTSNKYRIESLEGNDFDISFGSASSGMQTAVPLGLIVENYSNHFNPQEVMNSALFKYFADVDRLKVFSPQVNVGDIRRRYVHILAEEPELSLYPDGQLQLMDYLVTQCFNKERDYNMTLMLATHSPYIINYINVLMRRYTSEVGKQAKISPDDVAVYYVNKLGGFYELMSTDVKTGEKVIDTRDLSEPMQAIFNDYQSLGQ